MQNRIIGIFLSVCLIVPVLGMFGWLQLKKKVVRKEVKHQLMAEVDRSELVLLKFSSEAAALELEWEHSTEFEYRGQMYDVVASETRGDSIYYWCWHDHHETALNRQLAALTRAALQKDPEHQNGQKQLVQFFHHLFFEDVASFSFVLTENVANRFISNTCFLRAWQSSPPSPPPQLG